MDFLIQLPNGIVTFVTVLICLALAHLLAYIFRIKKQPWKGVFLVLPLLATGYFASTLILIPLKEIIDVNRNILQKDLPRKADRLSLVDIRLDFESLYYHYVFDDDAAEDAEENFKQAMDAYFSGKKIYEDKCHDFNLLKNAKNKTLKMVKLDYITLDYSLHDVTRTRKLTLSECLKNVAYWTHRRR